MFEVKGRKVTLLSGSNELLEVAAVIVAKGRPLGKPVLNCRPDKLFLAQTWGGDPAAGALRLGVESRAAHAIHVLCRPCSCHWGSLSPGGPFNLSSCLDAVVKGRGDEERRNDSTGPQKGSRCKGLLRGV